MEEYHSLKILVGSAEMHLEEILEEFKGNFVSKTLQDKLLSAIELLDEIVDEIEWLIMIDEILLPEDFEQVLKYSFSDYSKTEIIEILLEKMSTEEKIEHYKKVTEE